MDEDNRRIDIDDLPKPAAELSDDEEKDVTGGVGGINVVLADGSVRQAAGTSLGTNKGITIGGGRTEDV